MWWWRSGISGETEACVRAFAQKAPSAEWQATTPALFHQNLTIMRGIETVTSRGQKGGDRKMRERKRGFLSTFMPKCYSRTSQLYLFGAILLCPCGGCRVQPCEMDQPLQDSRMAPDATPSAPALGLRRKHVAVENVIAPPNLNKGITPPTLTSRSCELASLLSFVPHIE